MQPQRETMTNNLADIIHLISFGNKNGTLTVERGDGKTQEEGFIIFVNGRVIEAKVGPYSGATAFNYLNTWQTCRFSFIKDAVNPHQSTQPLPDKTDRLPTTSDYTRTQGPQHTEPNRYYDGGAMPSPRPSRTYFGNTTLQNPDATQLPRHHRRLLLLVNGQRSIDELARLMTRSLDEVQRLLHDLRRAGLIQD